MRGNSRISLGRFFTVAISAILLTALIWVAPWPLKAQVTPPVTSIPDLAGIWDGSGRSHPTNSVNVPWGKAWREGSTLPDGTKAGRNHPPNFPEVNERALAYMKVFDEVIAPKYDCQPSTLPALPYDPFNMEIVQWPDRVLLRYEKDDQLRTVWLDGRTPTPHDYGIQGLSVGRYEGNALIVETTNFVFDITGFDDYNGIPSSSQKRVHERYWREGEQLKATVTVEDPLFLRKPASYTMRWLPAAKGYKLRAFECDPEAARLSTQFIPSRYK